MHFADRFRSVEVVREGDMSTSKMTWLYAGQSIFGLLIGILVGLSISPVVGTVLGLLFAFIGGSVILLLKGRTEEELELTGKSIAALSGFMVLGVVIGINVRVNDLLAYDFSGSVENSGVPYLSKPLTIDMIKSLGANKRYHNLICEIVKAEVAARNQADPVVQQQLGLGQLQELTKEKVDPSILFALMGYEVDCATGDLQKASGSRGVLFSDKSGRDTD